MNCAYKKDCPNTGEPPEGSDAFICKDCLAQVQERARAAYAEWFKRIARHQNN